MRTRAQDSVAGPALPATLDRRCEQRRMLTGWPVSALPSDRVVAIEFVDDVTLVTSIGRFDDTGDSRSSRDGL